MRKIVSEKRFFLCCLIVTISLGLIFSCSTFQKKKEKIKPPEAKVELKQEKVVKNPDFLSGKIVIKKIEHYKEIPYGLWVGGTFGDFLIKNTKIVVVVSALDKKVENLLSGGNIIDAARVDDPLDEIGHIYFKYGSNTPPSYKYLKAEIKTEDYPNNGSALIVSGKEDGRDVFITTEYILEPDSPYLKIVTTIENKTTDTLRNLLCQDHINYGSLGGFIENYGATDPQRTIATESNWMGGQKDNFSIGFAQIEGKMKGLSSGNEADITYKQIDIQPGQKLGYERYMILAERSLSNISDKVYELKKIPYGYLSGKVVNPANREGVGGVDVQLLISRIGDTPVPVRPFTRTYSSETGVIGSFNIRVPVGSYFIRAKPFAREVSKSNLSIPVREGETNVVELQVSNEFKAKYKVMDKDTKKPIPCKITFLAIPPTQYLDWGFPKKASSRNACCSATGEGEIVIPPGSYRVTVSHGPEYEILEKDYDIGPGKNSLIEAELKRVIDTTGFVSMDIGVKTNATYGCPVSANDRLTQAVAEGLDVVVSGDYNTATDLEQTVQELGFESKIKTIIGKRIIFPGGSTLGEFTIFPIAKDKIELTKGDEELNAKSQKELLKILRKKYEGSLIQLNRPLFPLIGFFTLAGYNMETTNKLEPLTDIPIDFDLYELWEGKKGGIKLLEKSTQLFFNILMKKYQSTLTVSTNSDFTYGEELGYPRTYVASSSDDPEKINVDEIIENLKKGRTIVTNGPFIKFTVNGKGPGEIVTDTDGKLDCSLEITAAPWIDTSYIDINKNGLFLKRVYQAPSDKVARYPREGSESKSEFVIPIKRDAIINVSVVGKRSLDPVVTPLFYGEGGGIIALAVTGPIFVDYDGNGKYDPPTKTDEVGE